MICVKIIHITKLAHRLHQRLRLYEQRLLKALSFICAILLLRGRHIFYFFFDIFRITIFFFFFKLNNNNKNNHGHQNINYI